MRNADARGKMGRRVVSRSHLSARVTDDTGSAPGRNVLFSASRFNRFSRQPMLWDAIY
jgi:hypothetical protein